MVLNQTIQAAKKWQDQFNDKPRDKVAYVRPDTDITWQVSPNIAWILSQNQSVRSNQKR